MEFGIAGIGAVTVICYLAGETVKTSKMDNKWIPIICGTFGAALGYVGYNIMPGFPAEDIITAIAVGIISGLSATGINQAIKQLKR